MDTDIEHLIGQVLLALKQECCALLQFYFQGLN